MFVNRTGVTHPTVPLVNGRDVYSYTRFFFFNREVNIEMSCNIIYRANELDYKKNIPGLTGAIDPYVEPPGEFGGQCSAVGSKYAGALRSAMDAVLAERPDIAALPNIEEGGRQNARTFLALVETKLISMGYNATDDVLNGNNNPNTGDLIAVWRTGDATMERYDAIIGAATTIGTATQTDFTGFIPLNCTATGGGNECGCNDGGGGFTPGTEPASLLSSVQAERIKYGTPMTATQLGTLLNTVAWNNRNAGWGLLSKTSGNRCPSPAGEISCDILFHQPTGLHYDVLIDSEGEARPTWSLAGEPPHTIELSRWRAPVQP
jgi:hypothetical protein